MTWNTVEKKPEYDGFYLVTEEIAMCVDSRTGAHSYAFEVREAEYCESDGGWKRDGIVAWAEMPMPYDPDRLSPH